jgi:hypothetical protein
MYSSTRALSLTFSWMARTRFISEVVSRTRESPSMPIEASAVRGFTKSGIWKLPAISKSEFCEKTAKWG